MTTIRDIQNLTHANLANFYGSETFYHNPLFRSINYSQGVKFVSDNGAAWLITDILAQVISNRKLKNEEFIVAKLKVNPDKSATLTFDDGNDNILVTQKYNSCDFPLPEISFYIENKVLYLPSER